MGTYFPASIDFGMAWFYPQYVRNHKNRSHREHCFCVHVRGNRARKQLQTVSFSRRDAFGIDSQLAGPTTGGCSSKKVIPLFSYFLQFRVTKPQL